MTKHWVLYILATLGLTALVLWVYRKFGTPEQPPVGREIVSVSTDDPNMIVDFSDGKPDWSTDYVDSLPVRSLTTTFVKKG